MIYGEVNAQREAVVQVTLCGKEGLEITIDAVVDTGFTDNLTLPAVLIQQMGYQLVGTSRARLADGRLTENDVHSAVIMWQGKRRTVHVHLAENEPLLGMLLLYGCTVTLHVVDGGEVTIEPDYKDD